jgi:4,5-DOPA dioxygenase extradiol
MTTTRNAPVFFISHGAPTFALEPGVLGPQLGALGQQLADVQAVVVVSPHWQTRALTVQSTAAPQTVHDFGGFPAALYALRYAAPGHPAFAAEVGALLGKAGYNVEFDDRRGLDHGAWVPLWHLLPAANIPVFQVSMPHRMDTQGALQLGQALGAMRARGVAVLASGSMTHNLYEIEHTDAPAQDYAVEFAHWVRQAVATNDVDRLLNYRSLAPHAQRAHPTEEHFLPLLVAMGARTDGDALQVIQGDITHGVLSMESYAWGLQ